MLSVGFGDYSAETNFNMQLDINNNYTIKSDDQLVFVLGRYNKQTRQTMPFIQFRLFFFQDTHWMLMFAHIYVCTSILRGQKIYDNE
jgi:hypothetical protein